MRACLLAVIAALACVGVAHADVLTPEHRYTVTGTGLDGGNVSGIHCRASAPAGDLDCLIVEDETGLLRRARLGGGALATAAPSGTVDATPIGARPQVTCGGLSPNREFDREAIAAQGDVVYLVGSHGCSRRKNLLDETAFRVTRLRLDATGQVTNIESSFRFSDVLQRARIESTDLSAYFGKRLQEGRDKKGVHLWDSERGLNIEGVVILGEVLYAGLRAPSLDGRAFLVGAPIATLFGPTESSMPPHVRRIPLGRDTGVRDMAALANGDLLVLSGPTELVNEGANEARRSRFALMRVTARDTVRDLGEVCYGEPVNGVCANRDAKAEAVLVLEETPELLRVLVLFDAPDASPREYRIALR